MVRGIIGWTSAAFIAIALPASGVQAGTGTYTISGAADLSFDGTDYTDEAFTFTLVGHTVVNEPYYQYIDPLASATVTLAGIGTFTVLEPTSLGTDSGGETALDQYEPQARNVFLWQADSPVNLDHSFSPVGSTLTEIIGDVIPTSGGDLQFPSTGAVTTPELTFAGTVTGSVPEPGPWALMLLGLGSVGALARTRRRPVAA
jgi:hypothetical protein